MPFWSLSIIHVPRKFEVGALNSKKNVTETFQSTNQLIITEMAWILDFLQETQSLILRDLPKLF